MLGGGWTDDRVLKRAILMATNSAVMRMQWVEFESVKAVRCKGGCPCACFFFGSICVYFDMFWVVFVDM